MGGESDRLCAMESRLKLKRSPPPAGPEPGTAKTSCTSADEFTNGRHQRTVLFVEMLSALHAIYSRNSVARTLMARLPRLFRTRSCVPLKNPITANLE